MHRLKEFNMNENMEWSGVEDIASPDPGGGGTAGWTADSTGSPTDRGEGGGTPATPAATPSPEAGGGGEPCTPPATCGGSRVALRGGRLEASPCHGVEWSGGHCFP